jgi:hypothetical protein
LSATATEALCVVVYEAGGAGRGEAGGTLRGGGESALYASSHYTAEAACGWARGTMVRARPHMAAMAASISAAVRGRYPVAAVTATSCTFVGVSVSSMTSLRILSASRSACASVSA